MRESAALPKPDKNHEGIVTKVTFRQFSLMEICDENIQSPEISDNEKEYQHDRRRSQVIARR